MPVHTIATPSGKTDGCRLEQVVIQARYVKADCLPYVGKICRFERPDVAMDQLEEALTSLAANGSGLAGERTNAVEAPGIDIIGLDHP